MIKPDGPCTNGFEYFPDAERCQVRHKNGERCTRIKNHGKADLNFTFLGTYHITPSDFIFYYPKPKLTLHHTTSLCGIITGHFNVPGYKSSLCSLVIGIER